MKLVQLQYLKKHLPLNLNWIGDTIAQIKREEKLLKGWRQSDNRVRKQIFDNTIKEFVEKLNITEDASVERMSWLAGIITLLRR